MGAPVKAFIPPVQIPGRLNGPRAFWVLWAGLLTPAEGGWFTALSVGPDEEVGWVILFLASDEARYITGQASTVDGGIPSSDIVGCRQARGEARPQAENAT